MHRRELYIKYMMNAGRMKDDGFLMSATKANMMNVIERAIIRADGAVTVVGAAENRCL